MTWKKFSGEIIQTPIHEEVEKVIEREYNAGNKLKVCIGTDSQVKGTVTDFVNITVPSADVKLLICQFFIPDPVRGYISCALFPVFFVI